MSSLDGIQLRLDKYFGGSLQDLSDESLNRVYRYLQSDSKEIDPFSRDYFERFTTQELEVTEELKSRRNDLDNIRAYLLGVIVPFKPDNVRVIKDYAITMRYVEFLNTCIGDIRVRIGDARYYGQVINLNEYEDSTGAKHSLDTTDFKYEFGTAEISEVHAFIKFLYNL